MIEPNPCPRCNGPATIYHGKEHPLFVGYPHFQRDGEDLYGVFCPVCRILVECGYPDEGEAIEDWNSGYLSIQDPADGLIDDYGEPAWKLVRITNKAD